MIIRVVKLILLLVIIGFVSTFLANTKGNTTINWIGWAIELPTNRLIIISLFLGLILIFIDRLWILICNIPKISFQKIEKLNREKVEQKLVKAFLLASHGEFEAAAKEASLVSDKTKDKYLGKLLKNHFQVITRMRLQNKGIENISEDYINSLTNDQTTAFVGHLALMRQAMIKGDFKQIIKQGEHAVNLEPQSKQVIEALFYSYAKVGYFENSLKNLKSLKKNKGIDTKKYKIIMADLNYLIAINHLKNNSDNHKALLCLSESLKFNPGHILSALKFSEINNKFNFKSKSIKVLENAFMISGHPLLLKKLSEKWNLTTSGARVSRSINLLNKNISNKSKIDIKIEIASYITTEKIWGEARKIINTIPEQDLTNLGYKVFAEIAGSENEIEKVKEYLLKAANAKPSPAYFCISCGFLNNEWSLHCFKCESLSTVEWTKIDNINLKKINRNDVDVISENHFNNKMIDYKI